MRILHINDYTCYSGTSAAAILMQQFPDATHAQVKRWLQDGADKLYLTAAGAERDDFIGHGRLNVAGAIAAAKTESGQHEFRPQPPEPLRTN